MKRIKTLRERLGKNQSEFAVMLGLASKGHVSEIEREDACSIRVALKLEELSDGALNASDLCSDVALVRSSTGVAA